MLQSDRFEEMEKETEAERRKTSERFEKLKEMVQQRDTIASGLREQLEQVKTGHTPFIFSFRLPVTVQKRIDRYEKKKDIWKRASGRSRNR